ncbi:heavy-metal-associated domain-containing protein [Listeria grayi]|uniref:Heavy metal-associated domain protein n=3 Tax=Listeria grayi TaxID=1641 RepID=D7UY60_LISGR|nr:heavy metal-associated domain-containing protein [Listeria grayi]EFI84618.1 heavy metal-associated domain protein [Listeria grayi DSM 20601]STY42827.1 Copper chaperone CopZ [Listeria grayi]
MMEKVLEIEGMTCAHCVARVKSALEGVAGVTSAEVDLESGTAKLHLQAAVTDDVLEGAVEDAGYEIV